VTSPEEPGQPSGPVSSRQAWARRARAGYDAVNSFLEVIADLTGVGFTAQRRTTRHRGDDHPSAELR
jgi:hypothetical protein